MSVYIYILHTCVCLYIYTTKRDTCEFWYSVNQRRCAVGTKGNQQNISAARNAQVFRFRQLFCTILIVAVLMFLLLLASLLLLLLLFWAYVVRSLGGIVKILRRRKKNCSASQVDGFLLAFACCMKKSHGKWFFDRWFHSHWNFAQYACWTYKWKGQTPHSPVTHTQTHLFTVRKRAKIEMERAAARRTRGWCGIEIK